MDAGRIFFLVLELPALVVAFTVHEFAHAYMADRLGDDTPRRLGRLTLDPVAHLDPFGCLFWVFAALSGIPWLFWAKPVPFNMRNLENPRRDAILIAIAGPCSNLLQVPVWLLILFAVRLAVQSTGGHLELEPLFNFLVQDVHMQQMPGAATLIAMVVANAVILNVMLAAFNMIPIPPLDGHYVLEGLGPPYVAQFYNTIRPFSFIILLVLIQTPLIGRAVGPFEELALLTVLRVAGAPL